MLRSSTVESGLTTNTYSPVGPLCTAAEGVTIASIMLAGGQSRATAIGAGALLGALTIAGAVATRFVAEHHVGYALALSAGVTIYVAASDLIPEVNREGGPALGWTVFAGLVLFAVADWLVSPFGVH